MCLFTSKIKVQNFTERNWSNITRLESRLLLDISNVSLGVRVLQVWNCCFVLNYCNVMIEIEVIKQYDIILDRFSLFKANFSFIGLFPAFFSHQLFFPFNLFIFKCLLREDRLSTQIKSTFFTDIKNNFRGK